MDIWVTREGKKLYTMNMADSHLINSIHFSRRKINAISREGNTHDTHIRIHVWVERLNMVLREANRRGIQA